MFSTAALRDLFDLFLRRGDKSISPSAASQLDLIKLDEYRAELLQDQVHTLAY